MLGQHSKENKNDDSFTSAEVELVDYIKGATEESNPLAETPLLHSNLLNAALEAVDYHEVAARFFESFE